jgi:Ca2+-binding RTX toxin-like protein
LIVSSTGIPSSNGNTPTPQSAEVQVLLNQAHNKPRIDVSSGTLNIYGSRGRDSIDVSFDGTDLNIQIDGLTDSVTKSIPLTSVGKISIFDYGGKHDITLEANVPGAFVDGGAGGDTIVALNAGDDTLHGGAGKDSLVGGSGNNRLKGGAGNNTIMAGSGNDTIHGTGTNDSLIGGPGNDLIFGGPGRDTILANIGLDTGSDTIVCGTGSESVVAAPMDSVTGSTGSDTVTGITST